MEPLATELAGVGPGVRVNKEVRGQSGGPLERLAAHLALKAFFLKQAKTFKVVSILVVNELQWDKTEPSKQSFFFFLINFLFMLSPVSWLVHCHEVFKPLIFFCQNQ